VRPVGIGLAQIGSPPGDADANRAATTAAAKQLFDDGADVVVLPELCMPWYSADFDTLAPVAEPVNGPTVEAWRERAAHAGGVVVGGLCERSGDVLYNTAVAVDRTGIIGHYRKLHLFAGENNCFAPGDLGLPIVATEFGVLGLCICYDLRFVEVVRVLALSGAEIICVPTAWLPGFDATRWDTDGLCPQAHGAVLQANLSQVFLACASQVGVFGRYEFLGSSIIVDPFGQRCIGPLPGQTERQAVITVDLDDVVRSQDRGSQIRPRLDRRTDVYTVSYKGRQL
jgi:N-carbamoylputrescine amidase